MSCIRFNTPEQRAQMRAAAPRMLTAEEAASRHPVPPVTESKLRRLRLLAEHPEPRIRESVASSYHAPVELYARLARDPDAGVRACLARNPAVPHDLLRALASDEVEQVRGCVVVNSAVPDDVIRALAEDASAVVRGLVAWKTGFACEAGAVDASRHSGEDRVQFAEATT